LVHAPNAPESKKALDREIEYAHNIYASDGHYLAAPHKSPYLPVTPDCELSCGPHPDSRMSFISLPARSSEEKLRHNCLRPPSPLSPAMYDTRRTRWGTRKRALNQIDRETSLPTDAGAESTDGECSCLATSEFFSRIYSLSLM
jgi:hypothetical protein